MKMCKNNSITIKNPQTGNSEAIKMAGLEFVDWGFFFFVSSEMEAFKAAYYYRDRIGCKIEFQNLADGWSPLMQKLKKWELSNNSRKLRHPSGVLVHLTRWVTFTHKGRKHE